MDRKYSRIYRVGKRKFRYNYEYHELEWVTDVTKQIEEDNRSWRADFGDRAGDLWEIRDGYVIADRIGLGLESWEENPKYWCHVYSEDIDMTLEGMVI